MRCSPKPLTSGHRHRIDRPAFFAILCKKRIFKLDKNLLVFYGKKIFWYISRFGIDLIEGVKVRIISTATLIEYYKQHPDAEQPLKAWVAEVKRANWQTANDIKAQYRHASILKNRRVVFNIKGNDHRLIVAIAYRLGAVYIKFIGTHQEYNRINADTIE